MHSKFRILHDRALDLFDKADKDKNGWLSKNELKKVIHADDNVRYELRIAGGRTWTEFWEELDEDDDGKITKEELYNYMIKIFKENVGKNTNEVFAAASVVFRSADSTFSGSVQQGTLNKSLSNDVGVQDTLRVLHKDRQSFWSGISGEESITLDELKAYIAAAQEKRALDVIEKVTSGKDEEEEKEEEEEKKKVGADEPSLDKDLWTSGDATVVERVEALRLCAKKVFDAADRDKNGILSKNELKKALQSQYDLRFAFKMVGGRTWFSFWEELDENDDGQIQLEELVAYFEKLGLDAAELSMEPVKSRAKEIFALADKDKNGWLSKTELKNVLQSDDDIRDYVRQAHGRTWHEFWAELDSDGDGKITFEELDAYINSSHHSQVPAN
eukprot:m.91839 g.91839  ORF g.91839 m.91839 type:complete len:387 (-) comp8880_c1_seq1:56-1216(-)